MNQLYLLIFQYQDYALLSIQAVLNLFTLLFVAFTIPVIIYVLIRQNVVVGLIQRILVITVFTTIFLLLQTIQTILDNENALWFFRLKFIPAAFIIPFYISFLSQVSMRKNPSFIRWFFYLIPFVFTALIFTPYIETSLSNGIIQTGSLFKGFIIFFLVVLDSGAITLGIDIYIFKSKREYSSLIFITVLLLCAGINLDFICLLLGVKCSSIFLPVSLMIVYLLLSYSLTLKFIRFYDEIARGISLENELIKVLDRSNSGVKIEKCGEDAGSGQLIVKPTGGDFTIYYDYSETEEYFIVGEVESEGIQGAFFETMSKSYIEVFLSRELSPAEILTNTNFFITTRHENKPGLSMAVCFRDKNEKQITIASAGHPAPLLFNARMAKIIPLKTSGKKIGLDKNSEYEEKKFKYSEGDLLVMFSDGISKAYNAKNESFDTKQFHSIIQKKAKQNPERIIDSIIQSFREFDALGKLRDDVSIMVVQL